MPRLRFPPRVALAPWLATASLAALPVAPASSQALATGVAAAALPGDATAAAAGNATSPPLNASSSEPAPALAAEASVATADFAGRWVSARDTLVLRISPEAQARWRQWRLFIGTRDVTALARLAAPGSIELASAAGPWPPGESALVVHGADGSELARLPLQVRTAAGFERSETTPRLDLGSEGRTTDRRSDGQPTSPRTGRAAGTLGAGLAWKAQRDGLALEAAANLAGHSQRERALRFATLGAQAPKADLADYRLALGWRGHGAEIGHVTGGTHPLLLQGFASRGLGLKGRLGERADVAVHALRGSAIVGYDELGGLDDAEHRVLALTFGTELVAGRPGALRAELSVLDAAVRSEAGFNIGSVPDAERSRGVGLRIAAASEGGRLAGELALARSRFTNPFDPALAQGGELQPVQPEQRHAVSASLRWAALQQWPLGDTSAGRLLDLSFDLRHDHAQPLYRSLGASVVPDQQATRAGMQLALSGATLQLGAATRVDNLARIATLLRTRTDEATSALTLPLATWLLPAPPSAPAAPKAATAETSTTNPDATTTTDAAAAAEPAAPAGGPGFNPWPTLSLNGKWVHQRAVNAPAEVDSGIAATHRPDQLTREQQLNLSWTLGAHSLGYGVSRSTVDNRQVGRERADFHRLAHQASLNLALGEAWRAALAVARTRQASIDTGLVNHTLGGSLQLDWAVNERWAVSASVKHDLADDSRELARQASDGAQLQFTHRFGMPGITKPLPGQAFLRLGYEAQRQRDSVAESALRYKAAWVDLGLSFSFF
ncbi:MAG: hypothetical protein JNJ89_00555 [Rubrivivax sp.]|nr:hypothetical protein [Rubrivivax sp.]